MLGRAFFNQGRYHEIKNKVAIVTGAASGIGREIADVYAKEGAKVAIADINLAQAEAAAQEIRDAGFEAMAVTMNVTDENQVNEAVEKVVQQYGSVDVLVSNAGIQIIEAADKPAFADWKKMLAIHLDGAFFNNKSLPQTYVCIRQGRQCYLHGISTLQRGFPVKSTLCNSKARLNRTL